MYMPKKSKDACLYDTWIFIVINENCIWVLLFRRAIRGSLRRPIYSEVEVGQTLLCDQGNNNVITLKMLTFNLLFITAYI